MNNKIRVSTLAFWAAGTLGLLGVVAVISNVFGAPGEIGRLGLAVILAGVLLDLHACLARASERETEAFQMGRRLGRPQDASTRARV